MNVEWWLSICCKSCLYLMSTTRSPYISVSLQLLWLPYTTFADHAIFFYLFLYSLLRCTPRHSSAHWQLPFYKSRFWLINQPFFVLHNICLCHPRLINSNHHEPFWCIGIRSYGNVYFFLIIVFLAHRKISYLRVNIIFVMHIYCKLFVIFADCNNGYASTY